MFQSASASLLAKIFGGVLLLGVLGIAAYEILTETVDGPNAAVLAEASASVERADLASDSPDALAFGDEDNPDAADAATGDAEAGPALTITYPVDDSHHDTPNIVFEGQVEPGSSVFAGPYEADVGPDGTWRIALVLSPGANGAKISATDAAGNVSEARVTVWLDVDPGVDDKSAEQSGDGKNEGEQAGEEEESEAGEEEPEAVPFTANHGNGSSDAVVPFDVFWGTATPKSVVAITSPFGSTEVDVDKFGNWEKKVFFENAPRGEEFAVTVSAVNGSQVFEFTALPLPE